MGEEMGRCTACRNKWLDKARLARFDRRVDQQMALEERGLIRVDDAAAILGIHRNTVTKYIREGIVKVELICYRAYWMKRRTVMELRLRLRREKESRDILQTRRVSRAI